MLNSVRYLLELHPINSEMAVLSEELVLTISMEDFFDKEKVMRAT